jgi:hypothetical protein
MTQDVIDPMYTIKIDNNCFDIRSLRDAIIYAISQHKVPQNPFNRKPFTESDIARITQKIAAVGLEPLSGAINFEPLDAPRPANEIIRTFPESTPIERRNMIFNQVYEILVRFGLIDGFHSYDYDEAFHSWDMVENPLVHLEARDLCESLDEEREMRRCNRALDAVQFP